MKLLPKAKENLNDSRVTFENQLQDKHGPVAWVLEADGQYLVLVAKQYPHSGNASFMELLVEEASESGADLVFYSDRDESYTVFDSEFYATEGTRSVGDSKRGRDVIWLERPMSDGVPLNEYLTGFEKPTTLAGNNQQLTQW